MAVKCKSCGSKNISLKKSCSYEEIYNLDFRTGNFSEVPHKVRGEEKVTIKCFDCGCIKAVDNAKHR